MWNGLSKEQRCIIAEKFMEWGNLVFVGLVIAQFVPGTAPLELKLILAGMLCVIIAYFLAILLMKGDD